MGEVQLLQCAQRSPHLIVFWRKLCIFIVTDLVLLEDYKKGLNTLFHFYPDEELETALFPPGGELDELLQVRFGNETCLFKSCDTLRECFSLLIPADWIHTANTQS